jgi:hypothetical protein
MLWLVGTLLLIAVLIGAALHYMTSVPGPTHRGPLPPLTADEAAMARRLARHVAAIGSVPHNIEHYEELEKAARYIEAELRALGYEPTPQVFAVDERSVRNIEVAIEPSDPARTRGTIVLGAHYDSYGDAPGANDNATGAAAIIELARALRDLRGRTDTRVRLVLFVNEEPPYFQTEHMGSYRYARLLAERGERVIGMFSLETIGCFFDAPGTQHYPPPFGLLYPGEGNFVAFVGLLRSRPLLHRVIRSFRAHTPFPSIGGVAPGFVPGIGWSDHWSFAQFGYPAVMVTDTAPFRYPHYHQPTDTPDKVDAEKLARVTAGLERVVRDLVRSESTPSAASPR